MSLEGPIDLTVIDRKVARAHAAVERALTGLDREESRDAARALDPFDGVREVSGQATFKALADLKPGPIHEAHRDALLRWVHELLQVRVAWDLVIDEADAIHAQDPMLSPRAAADDRLQATLLKSFAEAFEAFVSAPEPIVATTALGRLAELAAPVAATRKELRARRFEAAHRLGLGHPWSQVVGDASKLESIAEAILDSTEPLARELHKDARRRHAGESPAHAIHDAMGRDAQEGWPARLGRRWLEDVFRAVTPRAPGLVLVPPALGGSSFLRAARAWGYAVRAGGTARSLPFALAQDPYPTEGYRVGHAFAIAVAGPVFARRKLGLTERSADAHARILGRTLFFTLRTTLAELLNAMPETMAMDRVDELGARVFGAPLPRSLGAAWSYGGFAATTRRASVASLPARVLGAIRSHELARNLVDRFDEDWFDNPRAGAHLASIGAGPIWQGELPAPAQAQAIARAFEELLG